jgi:hypothetical protein
MAEDLKEILHETYGTEVGERLIVVIPSPRVTSEEYLEALRNSGVGSRALGVGSARVVDQEGHKYRVTGAYVGAVASEQSDKAEKIARLCGITMVIFD